MKQDIDAIAKEIVRSIYDNNHNFMYYTKGYRICGNIVKYNSNDVTAKSTTIRITRIFDPSMKELERHLGNEIKIGTYNGKRTIYLKLVPNELKLDGIETVLGYEDLFDFLADHSHPNIIDYTGYNNAPYFQYLDFIVHVNNASDDNCVIHSIESNSKGYKVITKSNNFYTRSVLTESGLLVKTLPKHGLKAYENLFIWIENQYIIKKIQTINKAQEMVDKYTSELKQDQQAIDDLKEQIAKLSKQLAEYENSLSGKKSIMTIYSDLIEFAK